MSIEIGDSLIVPVGTFTEVRFENAYKMDRRELNSGGFATVHKARFRTDRSQAFAVKVFERTGYSKQDQKIITEVEILQKLQEIPNVVRLVDFYVSEDRMFMVQELARGGDICEQVAEYGPYEEAPASVIVRTLLSTIHTMHTRFHIVHRDIKPENILLRSRHNETDVMLCDFGSATYLPKSKHRGLITRNGATPAYSAPELLKRMEYREEADIWSMGCVLFILLGGYNPFVGDNDAETAEYAAMGDYGEFRDDEIWDIISDDAKDLIQQMLTVNRQDRCSAWQALQHEWLRDSGKLDDEPQQSSGTTATTTTIAESEPISSSSKNADLDGSAHVHFADSSTENVTNFAANTANKLSAAKRSAFHKSRNESHPCCFGDLDDSCYGDETETEATGFTDSSRFQDDDVLFVMGDCSEMERGDTVGTSGLSISSNSLYDVHEYDDCSDDDHDLIKKIEVCSVDEEEKEPDGTCYYSIEELQKMSVPGLDYKNREKYLSDKDFQVVFDATREEVATWKPWKVMQRKRKSRLW